MSTLPKRVMVAEDNSSLASVLKLNLNRSGFEVSVARNGEEAWVMYQQQSFDLVITDHQMPKLKGVELCRRIRSTESGQQIPLIMLTAKTIELNTEELKKELQLVALIPKPFSPTAIVNMVDETLSVTH